VERRVNRGEVWLAYDGRTRRPVLVLTCNEVLDVRSMVTVAEIFTTARGLTTEVHFDHIAAGLDRASVVNADGLHTVALTTRNDQLDDNELAQVCAAVSYALGC
jgi:mRNA-degrading endonuclease toxin of MazEF toxin-antitoxin module